MAVPDLIMMWRLYGDDVKGACAENGSDEMVQMMHGNDILWRWKGEREIPLLIPSPSRWGATFPVKISRSTTQIQMKEYEAKNTGPLQKPWLLFPHENRTFLVQMRLFLCFYPTIKQVFLYYRFRCNCSVGLQTKCNSYNTVTTIIVETMWTKVSVVTAWRQTDRHGRVFMVFFAGATVEKNARLQHSFHIIPLLPSQNGQVSQDHIVVQCDWGVHFHFLSAVCWNDLGPTWWSIQQMAV